MPHSLTALVGLGIILGSNAPVQPVQSQAPAQTEIAPGSSISPLDTTSPETPSFVLMDQAGSDSLTAAGVPLPLTIGTSGLLAFGTLTHSTARNEKIKAPISEPHLAEPNRLEAWMPDRH